MTALQFQQLTSLPRITETHMHYSVEYKVESAGPFERFNFYKIVPDHNLRTHLCMYKIGNTLIDTGSEATADTLLAILDQSAICRVILTHHHEDHIGGLPALIKRWPHLQIYAPKQLTKIIQQGFVVPDYRAAYWASLSKWPLSAEIHPYDEKTVFTESENLINVISTPGHTPFHLSPYIIKESEIFIITADLYLAPRLPMALWETSVPAMIDSLEKIIALEASFNKKLTALPSHGKILQNSTKKLQALQNWYVKISESVQATAARIGSRDYYRIFEEMYNQYERLEIVSRGELSRLNLIRGVLDPVTELPATILAPKQ